MRVLCRQKAGRTIVVGRSTFIFDSHGVCEIKMGGYDFMRDLKGLLMMTGMRLMDDSEVVKAPEPAPAVVEAPAPPEPAPAPRPEPKEESSSTPVTILDMSDVDKVKEDKPKKKKIKRKRASKKETD